MRKILHVIQNRLSDSGTKPVERIIAIVPAGTPRFPSRGTAATTLKAVATDRQLSPVATVGGRLTN
ncbi:MAG TPA: hypothetical protein VNS88_01280, partial [Nitrospiraceae bacterium]|nr:hypothetical protein [Nitrospiraceae bacterium]